MFSLNIKQLVHCRFILNSELICDTQNIERIYIIIKIISVSYHS